MNIVYFISLCNACRNCFNSKGSGSSGKLKQQVIQELKEVLEIAEDDLFIRGKISENDYAEISTIITEYSLVCFGCVRETAYISDEVERVYVVPCEKDFRKMKKRGDIWVKNRKRRTKKESNLIRLKFK